MQGLNYEMAAFKQTNKVGPLTRSLPFCLREYYCVWPRAWDSRTLSTELKQTDIHFTYQNIVGGLRSVQNDVQVLFRRVEVPRAEPNGADGNCRLEEITRHLAVLQR